jgi:hypothetical protein
MHDESSERPGNGLIRPGIFVMRGMAVRIPIGGLSIATDLEGNFTATLTLQVGLDVCPIWLTIAEGHLSEAQTSNRQLDSASTSADEEAIATHLESDLRSSLQAVVASAIAVDAFYAALRQFVQIDEATLSAWRDRGTARYKQVGETMRRAFQMKPRNAVQLRNALKQLYYYRDVSVHPDLSYTEASPHPEARRNTAKLLTTFRYPNARELAKVAISLISQGCMSAKSPFPEAAKYFADLRPKIEPILTRWEQRHGPAFNRS